MSTNISALVQFFQPISKQLWKSNSVTVCTECNNRFHQRLLSSGKHHCRNCGNTICSNCSKSKIANHRICNQCFSAFKVCDKEYQHLLESWNQIRPSNIHNDFCEHHSDVCKSNDRVSFILEHYHSWLQINGFSQQFHLNAVDFQSLLTNYDITALYDDYLHILNDHPHQKQMDLCALNNCIPMMRNMRESRDFAGNMDETVSLYKISNICREIHHIALQQLLDIIHCFLYHNSNNVIHNSYKFVTELNKDEEKAVKNQNKYGFGVEINYWNPTNPRYCAPKHQNLKSELLMNTVYKLELFEYESILMRAEKYSKTKKCKKGKARNAGYRNKMYGVRKKDVMTLDHIISIMTYCNNNALQRLFKTTYRANTEQHDQIAKWARYIFETVVFYGKSIQQTDVFYHGINQTIMFDAFETEFFIPISSTIDHGVATSFSTDNGIIVEIGKTTSDSLRCLNVSSLSAYPSEKERLFVYGFLQFHNIWFCGISMKTYVPVLVLFDKMIKGSYFAFDTSLYDETSQSIFVSLMHNFMHNNDCNVKEIPVYIVDLFRFRCEKNNSIFINKEELQSLNSNLRNIFLELFIPYLSEKHHTITKDIVTYLWKITDDNLVAFWNKQESEMKGSAFQYDYDEQQVQISFEPICSRDSQHNDGYFCFGFDTNYENDCIDAVEYEFEILIQNNLFHTTASAVSVKKKSVRIPYLFPSKELSSFNSIDLLLCVRIINVRWKDNNDIASDNKEIHNILTGYYGMNVE